MGFRRRRRTFRGRRNRRAFAKGRRMKRLNYPRLTRGGFRL